MEKLLAIAKLDSAIIRKVAEPVSDIQSDTIQNLIDDLLLTCSDAGGMGIAAPQVFQSKSLFILSSHPNKRYPHAPAMEAIAIINPSITFKSQEIEEGWEGCLSVPGVRGLVPRHTFIKVKYTTRQGDLVKTYYQGFLARIFQHELDHLNGIVFTDRVESQSKLFTEQQYQEIVLKL